MLINTKEIIDIINKKREKINQYVFEIGELCIVTLFDKNDKMLTKALDHTGNSEYGDAIYWVKEVTEEDFQYLTIGHVNIWLSANKAEIDVVEGYKDTIYL